MSHDDQPATDVDAALLAADVMMRVAARSVSEVEDLVTGARWSWTDHNFVRLDAFTEPVHILHVKETK